MGKVREFCRPLTGEEIKKAEEMFPPLKGTPPMVYFNCQGKPYIWPEPTPYQLSFLKSAKRPNY